MTFSECCLATWGVAPLLVSSLSIGNYDRFLAELVFKVHHNYGCRIISLAS